MTHGIVYVSWGFHNLNETCRSAWWLKGQYPACLITDKESVVPHPELFSHIIQIDFAEYSGLHHFYRKMAAIELTPFDVSLYLDGDTWPIGDLSLGFRMAEKHRFACCIAPAGSFVFGDTEYVHFNCGALWYYGKPNYWKEKVLSKATVFCESDEPAWSIAWDELCVNPVVLPDVFNFVVAGPVLPRPVRIWHSRYRPHQELTHQMQELYSS